SSTRATPMYFTISADTQVVTRQLRKLTARMCTLGQAYPLCLVSLSWDAKADHGIQLRAQKGVIQPLLEELATRPAKKASDSDYKGFKEALPELVACEKVCPVTYNKSLRPDWPT